MTPRLTIASSLSRAAGRCLRCASCGRPIRRGCLIGLSSPTARLIRRWRACLKTLRSIFPALDIEYILLPRRHRFQPLFRETDGCAGAGDDAVCDGGRQRRFSALGRPGAQSGFSGSSRSDYVCCGGGIGGFAVYARKHASLGGLRGPLNRLAYRDMPYDRSLDLYESSAADRLLRGLRNSWSYYGVYRSPALLTIWSEVAEINL